MRYRKRVKILPGLNLNVSKSGLSLSAGVRGASVTLGKRGTYVNYGIPGTGLYDRHRVGASSSTNRSVARSPAQHTTMQISVKLDEKGKPVISDGNGQTITDESILRQIKRDRSFKETVLKLSQKKAEETAQQIAKFVNIHQSSPQILTQAQLKEALRDLRFVAYEMQSFNRAAPTKAQVLTDIESQARSEIKSVLFWTNKRRGKEFVEENLEARYSESLSLWELEKRKFLDSEIAHKETEDARRKKEYDETKHMLESKLQGSAEYIEAATDEFLSELALPVSFEISYQYDDSKKVLYVDLDLPEIEDLPTDKANILASGKLSIKKKSQKELKHDYANCVTGLGFFFASCLFNISPVISSVLISGYTQRLSKKTGKMEDEYIYSCLFDRKTLGRIGIQNIEPVEAIKNFKHQMSITASFDLRTVTPSEPDVI